MQYKNTETRFGVVSIFLHWLMTILMIGLLLLGLYMTRIPISLLKLKLYGLHKEVGILILVLAIIRIIWRFTNAVPHLTMPRWEVIVAKAAHFAFYAFMLILPVTGWIMSSAAGLQVSLFGWFELPDFVGPSEHLQAIMIEVHKWLAYCLIAAICVHVVAALKHHFINNDTVLRRMLWP